MVCENLQLLNILSIFKLIVNMITIIVPVILVIFVIIDLVKTTSSGDVDTKKLFKVVSKRVVAAVIVFIIPLIINLILSFFTDTNYYLNCYNNADKEYILGASEKLANEAINKAKNECAANPNYASYELARKAVRDITDKKVRKTYEDDIDDLGVLCTEKKNDTVDNNTSTSTPTSTKTLWVGDSRVLGIFQNNGICPQGDTCYNDSVIAKVGEDYNWFNNTAISKINDLLKKNSNSKFNIVINIGVNGVGKTGSNADNFKSKIQDLKSSDWSNHNVVFVSVNPVEDGKSSAYNDGIKKFNDVIKSTAGIKYCNTNTNLTFEYTDGLHYKGSTNAKIYDYVTNNCI